MELAALTLLGTDDLQIGQDVHDLDESCGVGPTLCLLLDHVNHLLNDDLDVAEGLSRSIISVFPKILEEFLLVLIIIEGGADVLEHACYVDRGVLSGKHECQAAEILVQLALEALTETGLDHVEDVPYVFLLAHPLEFLEFLFHLQVLFALQLPLLIREGEVYLCDEGRLLYLAGKEGLGEGLSRELSQLIAILSLLEESLIVFQILREGHLNDAEAFCQVQAVALRLLLGRALIFIANVNHVLLLVLQILFLGCSPGVNPLLHNVLFGFIEGHIAIFEEGLELGTATGKLRLHPLFSCIGIGLLSLLILHLFACLAGALHLV